MGVLKRATLDTLEADSQEFSRICDRIAGRDPYYDAIEIDPATGEPTTTKDLPSPSDAVTAMGFSYGAFRKYALASPSRTKEYEAALNDRAHVLAEQALHIADTTLPEQAEIARARLRVDTRRWLARSYAPQRFGATDGTQTAVGVTIVISERDRAI